MAHETASAGLLTSYALLGVEEDASERDVRKAFERLAKRWHPDQNKAPGAADKFQSLVQAYAVIRSASTEGPRQGRVESGRHCLPVACSGCGGPLQIPQCREYVGVISFLFWHRRQLMAGYFCRRCGDRAALTASLVSGLFGWWGVQGLALAPWSIAGNAVGGRRDRARTMAAYCRNLLVYHAAGDLLTVRYLSALLLRERASVPIEVRLVMDASGGGEADMSLAPYFAERAGTWSRWMRHLACAAIVPLCVAAAATAMIAGS